MKYYRCGWCGHPTDKAANPIDFDKDTVEELYKGAEHVNGRCCPGGDQSPYDYPQRVTREMAMDAGDLSLEGLII